jgi:hypothetical protein
MSADPTLQQMRDFLAQPALEMGADDFDVEEAIYAFAGDYHGGLGSNLYAALCQSGFRPGPLWSGLEEESVAAYLYGHLEAEYVAGGDK